jgi:hypothetical protein
MMVPNWISASVARGILSRMRTKGIFQARISSDGFGSRCTRSGNEAATYFKPLSRPRFERDYIHVLVWIRDSSCRSKADSPLRELDRSNVIVPIVRNIGINATHGDRDVAADIELKEMGKFIYLEP